ncbi:MAG: methylenetetrahydrofolate reductase [Planctomycetota bacterium]|nr:methylenetetrahydrofolate reductase [Planctomycetota bacterium]MCX8039623.1 methylenetetrahydrofolate reductase [Planctomycetota bacterium]MDW8373082.1 methylenetetrahydrofolate reductase [Planctomycetota bacterium]
MRLDALFERRPRTLSFEFFPPKNERAWHTLEDTIEQLAPLGPDFVSVTYGAGGSTRARTREVVQHIQARSGLTAMAHLTCVGASRNELRAILAEYAAAGIVNILALRGDPPQGETRFSPPPDGCRYASELIDLVRDDGRFAILCAAYPEGHPEAPSRAADWAFLADKLRRGACAAITQCFFELAPYLELVRHLTALLGRRPRIIPGILPIVDYQALQRFCQRCGANIPPALAARLAACAADRVAMRKEGIAYTIALCRELLHAGAPGLHIYALNRSTAAAEIVTALRLEGCLP